MPKEPPVERFRIWVDDVEPADVGPTMAALTKLGRGKVGFELIEDVRAFAKKTNHDVKAEDFLTAWIANNPTFRVSEVIKVFREDGRTDGAGYTAVRILVEKKVLRKLDPGHYARADVKHIEGPKKKPKDPEAAGNRYEVSHKDFILRIGRQNHGRFSAAKVKDRFEKDGRNRDSVSTAIDDLLKRKLIKRVSEGEYLLLNMAAEQPKTNGNGAVEAAHG